MLFGDRRVTGPAPSYTIERTPAPVHYHPLELYAMGLLPASEVPEFSIFTNQGQFDADSAASPGIGTAVEGETRQGSIADIVRQHGRRDGPAPGTWRRATVVVSRERLLSPAEMDYWNFFAQRLADRNEASRATRTGFVSFRRATQNAVRLSTAIEPLGGPGLPQTLDTDTPSFGAADVRGVTFTSPVPTRFVAGQAVTISGRVVATDRSDFSQVQLGYWKIDGTTPAYFGSTLNRVGDFTVTVRFSAGDKGAYSMSTYLFWPGSGSQFPRTSLTSITVE